MSTITWAAATSRVWSSEEPDGGIFQWLLLIKQYQDKRSNTHKLEQSATVLEALNFLPGALIFLLQGSWSAASCHKLLDDAFGLLHTACYEQQGIHLVVWQSGHFAASRFSGCQQSYIKHETSRKTNWQYPVSYKARLVRCHQTTRRMQAVAEEGSPGYIWNTIAWNLRASLYSPQIAMDHQRAPYPILPG